MSITEAPLANMHPSARNGGTRTYEIPTIRTSPTMARPNMYLGQDVEVSPKPPVGSGDLGHGPAGERIQATTAGMTIAYRYGPSPLASSHTLSLPSWRSTTRAMDATVSKVSHPVTHPVTSVSLASLKTTWSFDVIFPDLPTKSEKKSTISIASTLLYPTPPAMPTRPKSTAHIIMGTDFATGTPSVMPMSMNAIPAIPGDATAWITMDGGKSLSFITAISPTTALSPSLDLQPTFTDSTTAATLSQSATSFPPPAQSGMAATATANETWMYPPASERFAIAVANPVAVAVVCLVVFAVTKYNSRRLRRKLDFYGPPEVEEQRPPMSGADLAGSGMKQLRRTSGDGPGRLDEDVSFEDFMGLPSRKAKPLPQAPGQPLVDAGGVDGEEHVSGDGARQDQGHQDDELDYHAMIRDL
ncbi:hypothetical protein LTR91_013611 [Friedmanniomyces endolithicus]|uniref:Uncharacterized protein n=1 Tax=Friedmanniomyces endolithicus TaxID=329885 RepID=A0AAN6KDD7_9PEZI|nr:hypothetical protein LTR57_016313 [Friedmanniomyces endolithicus]KAK0969593.1 hypothetical protein LTS01_016197 [Friedmanniomyces endolithicus]KAK0976577.1 hypothetical protein LTR91_013611 [Friedmanniomyces endolithicus]KAK1035348.1 hypothetical protein LTS16_014680 [Friedmanniomyces endolithicus]